MAHFSMPGVRPVAGGLLMFFLSLVSFCLTAQPMWVKAINPGAAGSNPAWLANANGTLYFGAQSGASFGLYKSNGTEAGTVKVRDFPVAPTHITYANGVAYFAASDGVHGREL
jgi:ELWxxDGT repeat protein